MIDQADQREPAAAHEDSPAQPDHPAALPPTSPASPRPLPWWSWPLAGVVCFLLLLWQVATHGPVTGLDIHVRDHILTWAATPSLGWLTAFGRVTANLGDPSVAVPVLPIVALLAAWRSRSLLPVVIAAGAGVALATVIPLKIWVGRPGPGTVVLEGAGFGYFPSGHTADAMLCYGTSALLLCLAFPAARRARQAVIMIAAALVLLTIFGLLWSDYHWLSDILGSLSWCGAALVLLCRFAAIRACAPLAKDTGHEGGHESQQHH